MKIEFNGGEFNSNANFDSEKMYNASFEKGKSIIRANGSLLLAILSFVLALLNLPFGLFMNFSTELLRKITEEGINNWIAALFVITVIVALLSLVCGVFAVALFAKSNKSLSHCAGLVISIISFVLCAVCLVLNVVGMVAW